jgi:hypothetical protein
LWPREPFARSKSGFCVVLGKAYAGETASQAKSRMARI